MFNQFDWLTKPSLSLRAAIGKLIGFAAGLVFALVFYLFFQGGGWQFGAGLILWYTFMGAFIGLAGVYTYHPVIKMALPWWFRGAVYGAFLNLTIVWMTYPLIQQMLFNGPDWFPFVSPYWLVLDGAILGFIIDWLATRYAGEGAETARFNSLSEE